MTDFPTELFQRSLAAPPGWPDNPRLRRVVEWLRGFMSKEEWRRRRDAAASRLFRAVRGGTPELGEAGRFFDSSDAFAWYLFLAEAYLDHPLNYEYIYGSRVLPLLDAIGRDLDPLVNVPALEDRVRHMVQDNPRQPNGTIFELLVASAYLDEGYGVAMVAEKKGQQQTHDFDATKGNTTWAVECKRMETSEYGERERQLVRKLWIPQADALAGAGKNVLCDVDFAVELDVVPASYLAGMVARWNGSAAPYTWSDDIARGRIRNLDLSSISKVLESDALACPSSRVMELLVGDYSPNRNYVSSIRAKAWDHPRYIRECDGAIVLQWSSSSPDARRKKARDGLTLIAKAVRQLPRDRPGVVHVGFEAVDGDALEIERLGRFKASMEGFDPEDVPLEYVYFHCLVPESPPDMAWRFRETGSWSGIRSTLPRPLRSPLLALEPRDEVVDGAHWEHRATWAEEDK